ncbi:cell division topological specificity factor MinE [Endozoicomonas sp. (ex Bugula neritina AB1)]|nr:cell division topological specificity factor MinE [Endozoicomonas sp. (ex Bugula neritina AB1)]
MNIRQLFKTAKEDSSAAIAKERLKIIVAHERLQRSGHDFLPAMQQDILNVVQKYINATEEHIQITLEQQDRFSVLEVNVQLPTVETADTY